MHRWMSDPAAGLPAWLLLEWESAVSVYEVQLIFDTGLHRHLTLSHHDGYTSQMLWGQSQLETVRDYHLEVNDGTKWKSVVEVTGNYQRLRRHRLATDSQVQAMRIQATETGGLDHARIVEGRVSGDDSIWQV